MVQVGSPAQQVHRHVPGPVADREASAVQFDATVGGELVESEHAQRDAQPPFPGDPRRPGLGRIWTVAADAALEVLPDVDEIQP